MQMDDSLENNFRHIQTESDDEISINIESNKFNHEPERKSAMSKLFEDMDNFLRDRISEINRLGLSRKQSNTIFNLVLDITKRINDLNSQIFDGNTQLGFKEVLNLSTNFVRDKLSSYNTTYKYKKEISSHPLFVPPVQKALGTRFEMKRCGDSKIAIPRVLQSTVEYVSIIQTIRTQFQRDDLLKAFLTQIEHPDHQCTDGVYVDFCCGNLYKTSEFYQSTKYCLQIKVGTDDFEVCNPLQSHSGVHKMCAVYFSIENLPKKYLSRLDNIYLVALCHSDDLKSEQCDFNDIWRLVNEEIKVLENDGIKLECGITLNGSISFCTYDNLGAHTCLGMAASFSCNYNCRFCENSSSEYQEIYFENQCQMRTQESYAAHLATIENLTHIDFKLTRGIKRKCDLNDLKYFHMLENKSVDIMHDLYEGILMRFTTKLFKYFIELGLFSEESINNKIQNFDYGEMYQANIPSKIVLKRANLGQNATQSRCLFLQLPFIFITYRRDQRLHHVWRLHECLSRIVRTVNSKRITEEDLQELEKDVATFLADYKPIFKDVITIKSHLLLHYPNIIREMGPIAHMSSIRMESKHKSLKDLQKPSANFKNVSFSIATKHQENLVFMVDTYSDNLAMGVQRTLNEVDLMNFRHILASYDQTKIQTIDWLKYNGYRYIRKLLISVENHLYEIHEILIINDEIFFVGSKYEVILFDIFLQSFKVQSSEQRIFELIHFLDLKNKKPFSIKRINDDKYVLDETIDLKTKYKDFI